MPVRRKTVIFVIRRLASISLTKRLALGMISYTNHTKRRIIMKVPKGKYAWTATVGEKGQIVIPKQARDVFGIKPGDTLLLLGDEKRGIAIPPKSAFAEIFDVAFSEKEDEESE